MKAEEYLQTMEIPSGVDCQFNGREFSCSKSGITLKRVINDLSVTLTISDGKITFRTAKPDKRARKVVMAYMAHLRNLFTGLDSKYTYKLETCNVHFPMTLKHDKNVLMINNFLGEKTPRKAVILSGVDVQLKGNQITLTSHDKEAVGQTAANIEKATKVRNRDRRVFQDGIYIIEKAGVAI